MAKRQHIIELNGQKYDALTGKLVTSTAVPVSATKTTTAFKPTPVKHAPKHLDGFVKRPAAAQKAATPKVAHKPATTSHVHKQPAKSQTLMRSAVKQPQPKKIHAKAAATPATQTTPQDTTTGLFGAVKPGRVIRASHVAQSSLISKFGRPTPVVKTGVIPVKAAPAAASITPAGAPKTKAHHTQAAKAAAKKTTHSAAKVDPFHAAIHNAVSHNQPKAKKPRVHHRIAKRLHVSPRLVSFMGVALLAVGVAGFLAYQNMPELAMRVASTRAGLNANLPSYQPAGFSMAGPIEYEPGSVTVKYKSNSDSRSFDVTQKNSSWNSETLLENYVSPTKEPYQTFQANGRTIYIYEGNKATWVDGGVWYNIDGKTNLNSDQLLRIAKSL